MQVTEPLARFAAELTAAVLPKEALMAAHKSFLDTSAVMMAGALTEWGQIVQHHHRDPAGGSAWLAAGGRAPTAALAALANGTAAHSLEYDDMHWTVMGHPSAVLVPVLIALGEALGAPGNRVVTAYVAGVEVMARLGRLVLPDHYESGWHSTACLGAVAAAAAGANLLQLDATRTAHAMGCGATMASGIRASFGSGAKAYQIGHAAFAGVTAALMAQAGLTASTRGLEAPYGFLAAYSGGAPWQERVEAAVGDLNRHWEVIGPGLGRKLYPCCGVMHAAVEAALRLHERIGGRTSAIAGVTCSLPPASIPVVPFLAPIGALEARFSPTHAVSVALVRGQAGLSEFTDEAVALPEVEQVRHLVEVAAHAGWTHRLKGFFPGEVSVKLADGTQLTEQVLQARGTSDNPMSDEALLAKFRECVTSRYPAEQANAIASELLSLSSQPDVAQLQLLS